MTMVIRTWTARIAGVLALLTALSACGGEPSAVPTSGSGDFAAADGSAEVFGDGERLIGYRVEVETGISWGATPEITPESFAAEIAAVWRNPRSWTGSAAHPVTAPDHDLVEASWRFQQVSGAQPALDDDPPGGPDDGERVRAPEPGRRAPSAARGRQQSGSADHDVRIRLATPDTVDAQCATIGLDTEGKYSCRFGDTIMINLRRWLQGSPVSPSIADYRANVINHEMGHFLGFGHQGCPAPGALAPVMMQQSIALDGCEPNPWPFTESGDFVSGPHQP